MTRHFILTASALALLSGVTAPVSATKPTPHDVQGVTSSGQQGAPMDQLDSIVANFPQPAPGMQQFVIMLPAQADEYAYRVGLIAGRMEETDGVNRVGIAGQLKRKTLAGWGYNYFEVEGADGPSMTTLIGVPPGTPRVTEFVSLQEKLVRYNSRLPLVIYAPNNFEVRYRVFTAGTEQTALAGPSGGPAISRPGNISGGNVSGAPDATSPMDRGDVISGGPGGLVRVGPGSGASGGTVTHAPSGLTVGGGRGVVQPIAPPPHQGPNNPAALDGKNQVALSAGVQTNLPPGTMATIQLYDSMLMDTDSTYAVHSVPILKLPTKLPMPSAQPNQQIVGPAVSVSIRDPQGNLIFWNDTVTSINDAGPTKVKLQRTN